MVNKLKVLYPYNEWEIIEERFDIENNYRNETIFALGNGYIGFRGDFEEGYNMPPGKGHGGTYINGFFESETIQYGELAYGYAERSQTILNVANSKIIKLSIDGEEFSMLSGEVLDYKRVLNLKEGILTRTVKWRSPMGKEISIHIKRLVSFNHKNLAAISYTVTPLNFDGKIRLTSILDGNVSNLASENDPRVGSKFKGKTLSEISRVVDKSQGAILHCTTNSGLSIACAMDNNLETDRSYTTFDSASNCSIGVGYTIDGCRGSSITLNKYVSYITSSDDEEDLLSKALKIACGGRNEGFSKIAEAQKEFMEEYWHLADIIINGDLPLQQGIRFNMFHLLQSSGRDGKTSAAAKGITGEGYEGHYFWDTEMFILPSFLYHHPDICRKFLEYRYFTLDKARERARQLSHKRGALYPWRTINGEECSAYFPGGTAQYHIDGDIAYAVKRYAESSQDMEFMVNCGAEILFETARLWADLGAFIEKKGGRFCIDGVTGPDEYTAIVNNNCYTNLLARENLWNAYETALWMNREHGEEFKVLKNKIHLEEWEIENWKKTADNMYIPYDEKLGIYPQDDNFLEKAVWDFENTPAENYPLLLHYHPLVIYRHQVCKQADLVLALFLMPDKFTKEEKQRNYDYYEKLTTHDSSLSTCIFSIIASEIGYRDKAYKYFMDTARMDLDDYRGDTKHGIHAANMAGTWMCLVNGFAGMRIREGILSFSPYLPVGWEGYAFKVVYQNRLLGISVQSMQTKYELLEGDSLTLLHNGRELYLCLREEQVMEN